MIVLVVCVSSTYGMIVLVACVSNTYRMIVLVYFSLFKSIE